MSSLIIDRKFIGFLSSRLRNFTRKGNGLSCFTHDCEKKDSKKKRAYFLEHKGSVFMKCHHCGVATSMYNFIKENDETMAKEYAMECFKEGVFGDYKKAPEMVPTTPPKKQATGVEFVGLLSYRDIPKSHPARKILARRMIPEARIDELWLAPKFYAWATQFEPDFSKFKVDHPRVVIPYYDEKKLLLGFVCRAFKDESPKYIQLRIDKNSEFLYGLNRLDATKPFIALEGQIDSMFLENAMAVGNANYGARFLHDNKENAIIVPDNDWRRNPEVCKQLKKAIDAGFNVCIIPEKWPKDINEIVKSGVKAEVIQDFIFKNSKRGPSALMEFVLEKRC